MSWEKDDFLTLVKDITGGNRKFQGSEYLEKGNFPIIDQGDEFIAGYTNENSIVNRDKDVVIFGDHTKTLKFVNFDFCLGADGVKVLQPCNSLDSKFLYYFLKTIKLPDVGYSRHYKFLKDLQIPLPPLPIQKRIAEILDAADVLKRKDQELLKKYDELAQAIFIDMFGDPVKNEKGIPLNELIKINPSKSELDNNFNTNIDVSFVPMKSVGEDGEFNGSEIRSYASVSSGFTYFKENDILFAKITPCMENGKGAIAKGLKNKIGFGSTEFHVLRPNEILNSSFLFHLTKLSNFRIYAESNMSGSAGQKRVPTSFFGKIKVDTEKLNNQIQFEKAVENISIAKAQLLKQSIDSTNLFNSLIQKAFKGELVA